MMFYNSLKRNHILWRNVLIIHAVLTTTLLVRNFSHHAKVLPVILEATESNMGTVSGSLASYKLHISAPLEEQSTLPKENRRSVQAQGDRNLLSTRRRALSIDREPYISESIHFASNQNATAHSPDGGALLVNQSEPLAIHNTNQSHNNLWEADDVIMPQWMKEYFAWHRDQLVILNEQRNIKDHRILVMRCLRRDAVCGGTADRLRPIPFVIRVAQKYQRILFIKWERPAPLEEFLLPPKGGLDWRMPKWLDELVVFGNRPVRSTRRLDSTMNSKKGMFLVDMTYQSAYYGSDYYDQELAEGEPTFEDVYNDVWRMVFEPSPAVRDLITERSASLRLHGTDYTALHIRSMYRNDKTGHKNMIENAVNCAYELNYSTVFVASDNGNVTRFAVEYASRFGKAVARLDGKEPLHLDRGGQYLKAPTSHQDELVASDFYDTWVDLYLMSGSSCTVYGIGGFGKWTGMIGRAKKTECQIHHARHRCRKPAEVSAVSM